MGCAMAIIGGLVAWCGVLLAFWGFGSAYAEDYETAKTVLPWAFIVGLVGISLVVGGMIKALSGDNEKKASDSRSNGIAIEDVLCWNCQRRIPGGSKTCECCGADLK